MKKNNLIPTLGCILSLSPAVLAASTGASQQDQKLNVIIILTDDVGYGDVGYTGNTIVKTPAMDQLYAESICFDNFHTGTTSAPSRSGLMTGIDGNRTGVWHTIAGRSILDADLYTLGDVFQDSGYRTAMFGKWHLGDNYPYRPVERGFDDVLCHKGGGIGQLPDYWDNTFFDDTYFRDRDIPEKQEGYCTDIFMRETERFVTENKDNPFFVYLAFNAAHAPFNVEAKYSDPYNDQVDARTAKIYGMITNIDDNVASLRRTLKEQGLDKNTVIILLGDNGSNVPFLDKDSFADESRGYNGGLRGKKAQAWEGGHRQAMLMHIPSQKGGITDNRLGMCFDIMPTLINLCDLTPSRDVKYDGIDLFSDEKRTDRIEVIDTQRGEFLEKHKETCVMKDDWRLIYGKELYNLATDKGQRKDVAAEHPELVAELSEAYEQWWDKISVDKDVRHPIWLTTDIKGESVVLNSHDVHTLIENGMPVWNQNALRTGAKMAKDTHFWSIYVEESGTYDFELYRWNPTSNLKLNAAEVEGRYIPNEGKRSPAGVAIKNMKSAAIYVDEVEVGRCDDFSSERTSISIHSVKLSKGYHEFKPVITDSEGRSYLAWFVKCTKK